MKKLKEIAIWFSQFGIHLYQVGGSIRDELMGIPSEDVDVCVVGGESFLKIDILLHKLMSEGFVEIFNAVHGSFPIWIVVIDGVKYEFAMARKEKKIGDSHQDFECDVNNVTIEEDLSRRDLTINAIAKSLLTDEIIDPYSGRIHIEYRIAHPVSYAFTDDDLRVYRAARFVARFNLQPSSFLVEYCKELDPSKISNERVGIELKKLFEQANKPSLFFNFLRDIGWLQHHFPELHALIGVPQSPTHHPEGDAFTHTMHCIDAVPKGDVFMRAVMLCHDLGKATHTIVGDFPWPEFKQDLKSFDVITGKITSPGHEEAGVELTKSLLKRIHFTSHKEIDRIACLVSLHMLRAVINKDNYDKVVRRVYRKLSEYELSYWVLCDVVFYDLCGRPPKEEPDRVKLYDQLYHSHVIHLIDNNKMEPIVTGVKLTKAGISPSPLMGTILKHALELQDRGILTKDNWQKRLHEAGYPIPTKTI